MAGVYRIMCIHRWHVRLRKIVSIVFVVVKSQDHYFYFIFLIIIIRF